MNPPASTPADGAELSTGELRAALQQIMFLRLTADHGPGFGEDTHVAAQYWGAGKVVLTRFPDGATLTLVAHQIRGARIAPGDTVVPHIRDAGAGARHHLV